MRHDPRAGTELHQEFRRQLRVELGKEIERDDRRPTQVRLQHVLPQEGRPVGDARGEGAIAAVLNELRVELDAHGARAAARGRDDDSAVAGAEVVDDVRRADAGDVEHVLHDRRGRRNERGVGCVLKGRTGAAGQQKGERRDDAAPCQRSAPISRR